MQIYTAVIVTLIFILSAVTAVCEVLTAKRTIERLFGERYDARVEEAEKERREKDRIDEGFENIMTFAVNGRTGFETE